MYPGLIDTVDSGPVPPSILNSMYSTLLVALDTPNCQLDFPLAWTATRE